MKKFSRTAAGIMALCLLFANGPVTAYAYAAAAADKTTDTRTDTESGIVSDTETTADSEAAADTGNVSGTEDAITEDPAEVTAIAKTGDYITVYSEADFVSEQVGKLYDGNIVTVESKRGAWYQIKSGNVEGYIVTDGTLDIDAEAAASVAEEERTYGETLEEESERIAEEEKAAEEAKAEAAAQQTADLRQSLVDYALQFVGNPYSWGGSSLTNGADCSGFVMAVYAHFGVSLPHSSRSDRSQGTEVSEEDMQPGDLVCYSGHVALYIGNGQIVHACSKKTGIIVSDVHYKSIICVRRIFN